LEHEVARLLLAPLAITSDDPDYIAQPSRVLVASGQTRLARSWRKRASARYDALVMLHPAAFADHAAEFWLCLGTDPEKALLLAELIFLCDRRRGLGTSSPAPPARARGPGGNCSFTQIKIIIPNGPEVTVATSAADPGGQTWTGARLHRLRELNALRVN
jgi:hypothetical protein